MPVSLKCEQCYAVKPCTLFLDEDREGAVIYLCRRCARELGLSPSIARSPVRETEAR